MIKAGLNIGNSKISCIVCDYTNSQKSKILSLVNVPTKDVKKNIITNYNGLSLEVKKLITESEKNSQTKLKSINVNIPAIDSVSNYYDSEIIINDEKISDLHIKKIINQSEFLNNISNKFELFNNIISYNVDNDSGLSHKDLMSNTEVQKIFDYIFEDDSYIVSDYIFTDKPNVRDESDKLLISTHSPVLLGAYDSHGNYTGIDPDQNIEEGAYYQYTEDIPGSSIRFFGESFYLFLPKNGEYDFLVQAYDEGEVDIDISIFSEDETQEIVSYKNIPVESKTQIIFTSEDENISGLDIDIDGDSDIDYVLSQEMDSEPPVVSAETQGEEKVTVTLTATDDTGVEVLEYSFDGEEWKNYEESLSFEEVGEYAIYYRATDYFNNISEVQSITFSILPRRSTRGGSHREEEEDESGEVKEVSVSRNELEEEKEPQIDSLTHDEIIPEIKTQKIYLNKQKIERKETLISTTTSDEKVEEASIVSVEYVDAWWYAGIKNFIKGTYHWFVSLFT